jgi:uncharacterized protein (DUF302 family)
MGLMKTMVKSMKKDKREKMMEDMMPLMMEGIDMSEFMPKMMANMMKDLTADQILNFIEEIANDNEKIAKFGAIMAEANMMPKMMMKRYKSKFGFEETINALEKSAPLNNWHVPDTRDLSKLWLEQGVENPYRVKILYFINSKCGRDITNEDEMKVMTVMMPMGVSVYETSDGSIEIAAMNIKMMSGMLPGKAKQGLGKSAENFNNCIKDIIKQ